MVQLPNSLLTFFSPLKLDTIVVLLPLEQESCCSMAMIIIGQIENGINVHVQRQSVIADTLLIIHRFISFVAKSKKGDTVNVHR